MTKDQFEDLVKAQDGKLTWRLASEIIRNVGVKTLHKNIGIEAIYLISYTNASTSVSHNSFYSPFRSAFKKARLFTTFKRPKLNRFKGQSDDELPKYGLRMSQEELVAFIQKHRVNKVTYKDIAAMLNISSASLYRYSGGYSDGIKHLRNQHYKSPNVPRKFDNSIVRHRVEKPECEALRLYKDKFMSDIPNITEADVAFIKARYRAHLTGDFRDLPRHYQHRRRVELNCNKLGWTEPVRYEWQKAV
jgi:hypothetical protein